MNYCALLFGVLVGAGIALGLLYSGRLLAEWFDHR